MTAVTHDEASDAVRIAYADETGSATAGVAFTTAQRYIEQQRAAEASTQALREAAERLQRALDSHYDNCESSRENALLRSIAEARDALRSALSSSPAQGGARHAWAPGQNARCVVGGNFYTIGRVYPVLAVYLNMITIVDDSGQELQVLADRFEPAGYRERVRALCATIDAWYSADRLFPERAADVLGARRALASEHPQP